MEETKKKYGLLTGIAMVMGTVIGAGVFIKGGDVLNASGGSLFNSLLAWLVGGIIMVVSAFCFAVYSTKVIKFNGCVDYVETATNKTVGYMFGYYLAKIYFPIFASGVGIVSAQNLIAIFVPDSNTELAWIYKESSYVVILVAALIITIFFLLNYLAPKIANYFQVSVLFVKVAPLLVVAVAGLFASFIKGAPGIINAFSENAISPEGVKDSFGEAVKITSFAYDGWVCVTALNAEMKDSKKNMPRAIMIGTILLVLFYIIYFIGCSALIGNQAIVDNGRFAGMVIFQRIFGFAGEIIFLLLLATSCAGNVNAMIFCISRSLIALGYRGQGFKPDLMTRANEKGNFSFLPYLLSYCYSIIFLIIWALAYNKIPVFEYLSDMDNITCSLLYCVFIVIYINMMKTFKDCNPFARYVMPILAIAGSVFFTLCGTGLYQLMVDGDTRPLISFACTMTLTVILMLPGVYLYYRKPKNNI